MLAKRTVSKSSKFGQNIKKWMHLNGNSLSYRTFEAWIDPETKSPVITDSKEAQIELYRGLANGRF